MSCKKKRIWNCCLAAIVVLSNGGFAAQADANGSRNAPVIAAKPNGADVVPFAWQVKSDAPQRILSKPQIYRRLLKSTGWVVTKDSAGRRYYSTAWIIDVQRRLAITCWHCVNKGPAVMYFPTRRNGTLITDPAHYVKKEKPIGVRIINTNRSIDLALLQLDSIPEGMTQLPLARRSPEVGEDMFTVGGKPNGSDGLWQFASGMVRLVCMQVNAQRYRTKMVQGQDGTNRGNSGGALINNRGEVIAVVEGGPLPHSAENVSWNVDVTIVRNFAEDAVKLLNPSSAADFVRRGKMHLADQRIVEALGDFNSAVRRDPRSQRALEYRGTLRYAAGDYRGAVEDFSLAVKSGSRRLDVYRLLGTAYSALGRNKDAISTLSKAIAIASQNPDLYRQRGTLHLKAGDYRAADADLTKALNLAAAMSRFRPYLSRAATYLERGMARYQLARYAEAMIDLRFAERGFRPKAHEARRARLLQGLCKLRLAKSTPNGKKAPSGSSQPKREVQYVTN